ncbi:MAG: PaaI family thioesterase [Acidimicrobiia bacterium]
MTSGADRAREVFDRAPFIADLGVTLIAVGDGWVETSLVVTDRLRQQHGFAHAGVVSTLADHTAGAAASTAVGEGRSVLTAGFNIHLLRPAAGEVLTCRGEIVRAGRTLIVTQADVRGEGKLCARYSGTMAVVDRPI